MATCLLNAAVDESPNTIALSTDEDVVELRPITIERSPPVPVFAYVPNTVSSVLLANVARPMAIA